MMGMTPEQMHDAVAAHEQTHNHPKRAAEVGAEPSGAVAAHLAASNPHPQYALLSSGWQNLTLATGWSGTAEYIKVGNLVFLNGVITKSTLPIKGEIISTLKSGFAPTRLIRFESIDNSLINLNLLSKPYFEVNALGQIVYGNYGTIPSSNTGLILSNIIFPIL